MKRDNITISLGNLEGKLHSLSGTQKYTAVAGLVLVLLILLFAGIGMYFMFGQMQENRDLAKQLAATQEEIKQKLSEQKSTPL